jgi:cell wall-associated NlpC family hydrolase
MIAMLVAALVTPIAALAEEGSPGTPATLPQVRTIVDTAIYAEPAAASTQLEWLPAGSTVTQMESPLTSPFDGRPWVLVASLQSLGYVHFAALEPDGPDIASPPLETKTVLATVSVACLTEPRPDAPFVVDVYPAQELEILGPAENDWQPVSCDGQSGFVPAWTFIAPPPAEEPAIQPPDDPAPADEPSNAPVLDDPSPADPIVPSDPTPDYDESPVTEEPASAAPTPADTAASDTREAAPSEPEASIAEISVAALVIGEATVTGTGGAGLRCRVSPDLGAAILNVVSEGASVQIRGAATGNWTPVTCQGREGFVWSTYLSTPNSSGAGSGGVPTNGDQQQFGQVRNTGGAGLRCRADASLDAAIVMVLAVGSTAPLRGAAVGVWQPVVCAGQNGWVHTDFFGTVTDASNPPTSPGGNTPPATNPSTHGFAPGQTVEVSGTGGLGLRFRAGPSFTAALVSVLPEGTKAVVTTGSSGAWIALSVGGNAGFAHGDFLIASAGGTTPPPTAPAGPNTPPSSDIASGSHAQVTESLRLRSEPTFSSSTIEVAPAGTVVKITGARTNGFYPVMWADLSGHMHGDYLTFTTLPLSSRTPAPTPSTPPLGNAGPGTGTATGQALVNFAMRYVGYPYVWATRGPNSFDCSGFTYWVAKNVLGIDITGGVILQWNYGREIPYGSLQPGDLVFFQNTYTVGLSHVGIYIGNNQFVHAANESVGVVVSDLTNTYYATRWFGARRLV